MSSKGTVVAAMVAGLFSSAAPAMAAGEKPAGKVKCSGINSCKGKAACMGMGNSCAGQNSCKGKGWIDCPDCRDGKDRSLNLNPTPK